MKRIKTDLNFWRKQLGKGWADEVYPLLIKDANYLGSGMTYADYLISNIEADNSNNITMSEPSMGVIFKAFRLTPYGSLKVLVFGQDPDHNGLANGLAFGNIENDPKDPDYIPTAVSSNLRKIEEVVVDMYNDGDDNAFIPFDYTLESWAKQGVLLLNAALTIVGSQPNSRADLWKPFTDAIVKTIHDYDTGVVIMLWGKRANAYADKFGIITPHHVLTSEHPAQAHRQNRKWLCSNFQEGNNLLLSMNRETVQWAMVSLK